MKDRNKEEESDLSKLACKVLGSEKGVLENHSLSLTDGSWLQSENKCGLIEFTENLFLSPCLISNIKTLVYLFQKFRVSSSYFISRSGYMCIMSQLHLSSFYFLV